MLKLSGLSVSQRIRREFPVSTSSQSRSSEADSPRALAFYPTFVSVVEDSTSNQRFAKDLSSTVLHKAAFTSKLFVLRV